MSKVKVVLSPI